jgi:phenylpropionate dioxygenase-like ring-hydroxylating dioxygenase large terminal subunit
MLVTEAPVLRRFWYCIARSSSLTQRPFHFRLLGEDIAFWRDEDGAVHAIRDRCLHRTAKLSLGWVEDGNIVCPYHGWSYNGVGMCVKVPQDVRDKPRPFGVAAYRCAERYGYIWVALDDPLFDIPDIPEFSAPGYRQVPEFCEVWAAHPLRIMENGFDASHVTFVHKNTFGNPDPSIRPPRIEERADGFTTYAEVEVKTPDHMKAALSTSEDRTTRTTENRFYLPFFRVAKIRYPSGLENILCTFLTPVYDGQTQFTQWVVRNDTVEQVAPETVVAFDREVTLEDRAILESTDDEVALDPADGDEVHMASDRPGLLMRKMLNAVVRANTAAPEPVGAR